MNRVVIQEGYAVPSFAGLSKKQRAARRGSKGARVLACLKRNHRKHGKHYSLKARADCGSTSARKRLAGKK